MFVCVYLQILIAPSFDFDSQLIFLPRAWGMKVHQLDELSWVSGLLSTLDIRWRSLSLIWAPGGWSFGAVLAPPSPFLPETRASLHCPQSPDPGAREGAWLPASATREGLSYESSGALGLPWWTLCPRPLWPGPQARGCLGCLCPTTLCPCNWRQASHGSFVLSSRILLNLYHGLFPWVWKETQARPSDFAGPS